MPKHQILVLCYGLLHPSCSDSSVSGAAAKQVVVCGNGNSLLAKSFSHQAIIGPNTTQLRGVQSGSLSSGILIQKVGHPSHARAS